MARVMSHEMWESLLSLRALRGRSQGAPGKMVQPLPWRPCGVRLEGIESWTLPASVLIGYTGAFWPHSLVLEPGRGSTSSAFTLMKLSWMIRSNGYACDRAPSADCLGTDSALGEWWYDFRIPPLVLQSTLLTRLGNRAGATEHALPLSASEADLVVSGSRKKPIVPVCTHVCVRMCVYVYMHVCVLCMYVMHIRIAWHACTYVMHICVYDMYPCYVCYVYTNACHACIMCAIRMYVYVCAYADNYGLYMYALMH